MKTYRGHIVNIAERTVRPGEIHVSDGIIRSVTELDSVPAGSPYYLPGFTDAHIHIESSMMVPENFAKVAAAHGTVGAVCDPHEIANVMGTEGIDFMIGNGKNSRFAFHFGLPSCVPSSHLESAGAVIDAAMTRELIRRDDLHFLAEMMNYPGVMSGDGEVMAKLEAAKEAGKPVDGHAPGLSGESLERYIVAGITTDHECYTPEEAAEKISKGMKVIVREGSAARNFDTLCPVLDSHPGKVMLCSDDKHPDDLIKGHIDEMVRRGIRKGISVWNMLEAACVVPVIHYGLSTGLMRPGDRATFIAVDNLSDFNVLTTVMDGFTVYDRETGVDESAITTGNAPLVPLNNFRAEPVSAADLDAGIHEGTVNVIVATDGELVTGRERVDASRLDDPGIQKIVVYNRYGKGNPKVGFIRGFGLSSGAFGTTVAHDSHNIVAAGTSDTEIADTVNALIRAEGGMAVTVGGHTHVLPLPVAGLMSTWDAERISSTYRMLDGKVKEMGCTMHAPFITLSFMALPVIKDLKITDKGLVDVNSFSIIPLAE